MIDTSPDLRFQLLKNNIKKISSILYTHQHADQTHGINDLRPFFFKNKRKINIYASSTTLSFLKRSFTYCFKKTPGYPAILRANKVKKNFVLGLGNEEIKFTSIEVSHGKINSMGYIFKNLAYISDCNNLSKINIKKLNDLNYLVIDCLRLDHHPSHFSLGEVLDVIKLINPRQTILTNLHSDLDYNYLLNILPKNIIPAYDGMSFYI